MLLSRSLRRLVAVIAAALFLACQGMAVARASSLAFPQSNAATVPESCRDTGQDTSKNTDDNVR